MIDVSIHMVEVLVATALGLLGAVIRIFIQYKRDGQLPEDGLSLYAECFLGVCAGGLAWLFVMPEDLRTTAIVSLTAGYSAADAIENWLSPKK